jgi:hypothetical protein
MKSYLRDMKGVFKFAAILTSLLVGVAFVVVSNAAVVAPAGVNTVLTTPKVVNSVPVMNSSSVRPDFDRPDFDRPAFNRPDFDRPAFNPFFDRPAFNPFFDRPVFNPFFNRPVFNPFFNRPVFNPFFRPVFNPFFDEDADFD